MVPSRAEIASGAVRSNSDDGAARCRGEERDVMNVSRPLSPKVLQLLFNWETVHAPGEVTWSSASQHHGIANQVHLNDVWTGDRINNLGSGRHSGREKICLANSIQLIGQSLCRVCATSLKS